MPNFIQNSIFTNYAIKRITKDLASKTYPTGSLLTGIIYKVGTGVVLNESNPSKSDFSGLKYVLNDKDPESGAYISTNITILRTDNTYSITIQPNPNMFNVGFSQLGMFTPDGNLVAFIDLGNVVQMTDFLVDNIYRIFITLDLDTRKLNLFKRTKSPQNLLGTGELLYKFISVKVGQGNNDLDPNKTDMSSLVYVLEIEDVYLSEENVITITALIPENLTGTTLTEIGLFENFQQGSKLFAYTKVNIVIPEDLGFKLVIKLNTELETVSFDGMPTLVLNSYKYANREDLSDLTKVFLEAETNLERTININGQEIGYNLPQTYFKKEKEIRDTLYSVSYATKYSQLLKHFGANIKDLFYITKQDYDLYSILNLADDNSMLAVSGNRITSTSDNITFNNGAISIAFTAKIKVDYNEKEDGRYLGDGIILTKANAEGIKYFDLLLETDDTVVPNTRKLRFLLNTSPDIIGFELNVKSSSFLYNKRMSNSYLHYIITFNGSLTSPEFNLYINGDSQSSIITAITSTETLYLADLSSSPLSNYRRLPELIKTEPLENVNILSLATFSKVITADDAYLVGLNMPDTSYVSED